MRTEEIAAFLGSRDAPPVLTAGHIKQLVGRGASGATASRVTRRLIEIGAIQKAMRGIFRNASKPSDLGAILPYVIPGGVLSLATVLGDDGVANNLTPNLHVVVSMENRGNVHNRTLTDGSRILVHRIPQRLMGFGIETSRGYNRAEPERALCDWLYLAASPHSRLREVPDDLDLEMLDRDKVRGYAARFGVEQELDGLVERVRLAEEATDNAPF